MPSNDTVFVTIGKYSSGQSMKVPYTRDFKVIDKFIFDLNTTMKLEMHCRIEFLLLKHQKYGYENEFYFFLKKVQEILFMIFSSDKFSEFLENQRLFTSVDRVRLGENLI